MKFLKIFILIIYFINGFFIRDLKILLIIYKNLYTIKYAFLSIENIL